MEEKFWRTLLRVNHITDDYVFFIIPGWDSERDVPVPLSSISNEVRAILKNGVRLHAKANIGVEDVRDIVIKDYELK
jgi:hypothetical protein